MQKREPKLAEGRMLKRAISDSRRLAALKTDTARLLYTWLIPFLDVEGRFSADPAVIKGHVVPRIRHIGLKTIVVCLSDMKQNELITLYEVDGDLYLEYRKFHTHQHLRKDKEGASKIPAPSQGRELNGNKTGIRRELNGSKAGGLPLKLREEKLIEEKLIKDKEKKQTPSGQFSTAPVEKSVDKKEEKTE